MIWSKQGPMKLRKPFLRNERVTKQRREQRQTLLVQLKFTKYHIGVKFNSGRVDLLHQFQVGR